MHTCTIWFRRIFAGGRFEAQQIIPDREHNRGTKWRALLLSLSLSVARNFVQAELANFCSAFLASGAFNMVASGNARNRRWPQRFSSLTKTGGVKEKEMKGTRRKQRQCRSKREVVEDIEI